MITRTITQELQATKKSVLLLGPRQAGKSTLIQQLSPDLEINLADEMELLRYSSRPEALREIIEDNQPRTVFVDEIQKVPRLLGTIQALLDRNKALKFYLTGSSARKLRKGEVNLLPGRVVNFNLGPLTARELGYKMDTRKALQFGSLPEPYLSSSEKDNARLLRSYSASYLKEEIRAESLVRNLDSFARFFQEASTSAARFVDYSKLSARSKISRHAVPRYFEILEDTLVAYRLNAYATDPELDLVKHPKFYFFDNGVYNGLLGNFTASADRMGTLTEQLVFSQLLHSAWALEKRIDVSSFRTRAGIEVDFIVELDQQTFAIEVKTSSDLSSDDLHGLKFFGENVRKNARLFAFHMGTSDRKRGNVWCLPWQKGLKEIGL